ncbi:hypothetical protein A2483_00355 [Candidatus Peregrinibacteria bacterium RIFOXYC2_FULL_33_13]|nr:MAG: hypothetical protein UR27_C0019G0009 [Candidatus Peregrinibacteria bacterium GW2011_GWA2_33_10]KKP39927.1 MAG: hypothetical protein UR30_C0007G0028 [Candidatus Peregrinibacteria bacterium GW2011_GWC2_33_13]OGJ47403.1 MAG: hypothetical protein A2229_02805 [Candidatus Peregrinibacteria bacterium RIFOXYA2_FULL_33_7]OGJ53531.1 MAG: hypothetical protein A2483_00355 [Candidatus Peregrinibacteria bacterium RIFOXYC2_FULL_33_13]
MKKILVAIFTFSIIFGFSACAQDTTNNGTNGTNGENNDDQTNNQEADEAFSQDPGFEKLIEQQQKAEAAAKSAEEAQNIENDLTETTSKLE